MQRGARDPTEEFEELRRLLLSREREQLRELSDRLSDKERRSQDIASVLPEAIKMSRERGEQLTHALRPAVEGSIKESIDQRPQLFVDALHPIIGPIVRKSVAETLRRLLQSFNQTLEHTFSWRGLKWRWEALRTGRSFAEVVMLRSLVYRVEQLFLIHRETSLSLLHVTRGRGAEQGFRHGGWNAERDSGFRPRLLRDRRRFRRWRNFAWANCKSGSRPGAMPIWLRSFAEIPRWSCARLSKKQSRPFTC